MSSDGVSFQRPGLFWFGCALLTFGVLAHVPMFLMGASTHYKLVGMPMSLAMWAGMAMIPFGLLLAAYGVMPEMQQVRRTLSGTSVRHYFHLADSAPLNHRHWTLVLVLVVALAVDVMKPATLGFVLPGMTAEYAISAESGALLVLVALTGTALGSVAWGRMGDVFGRRAAILLSALIFMGTSICGAMPAFSWNLLMCFLMGASAGGLLPIAFTLMAETVPAAHRGWLLVALGGIGTSAGYLLASGAAAWLEPMFSWRVLWLLGLPTGAVIIVLNRWIPESPRFLSNAGFGNSARKVLRNFSDGSNQWIAREETESVAAPIVDEQHAVAGLRMLLRGRHAALSAGLILCGLAWGLANFGFLLWLPTNLAQLGVDAGAASMLLARSALIALPGVAIVVWLYHRWSSVRSLALFIGLTTLSLLAFILMDVLQLQWVTLTIAATVALLVSVSGVIAMLIPYAAEIYPLRLRGTGAGVIAASSKVGGIVGAGLGVLGLFEHIALSAALIGVAMLAAGVLLLRTGVETRGLTLEQIQCQFKGSHPNGCVSGCGDGN